MRQTTDNIPSAQKKFAELYAKSGLVTQSYLDAYYEVNKVRAATLLQNQRTIQYIVDFLKKKKDLNDKETMIIESYDLYLSNFDMSPMDAFDLYCEEKKGRSVSDLLNVNPVFELQCLFYLLHFYSAMEREYQRNRIKERIRKVKKIVFNLEAEMTRIKRQLRKDNVDYEDILL